MTVFLVLVLMPEDLAVPSSFRAAEPVAVEDEVVWVEDETEVITLPDTVTTVVISSTVGVCVVVGVVEVVVSFVLAFVLVVEVFDVVVGGGGVELADVVGVEDGVVEVEEGVLLVVVVEDVVGVALGVVEVSVGVDEAEVDVDGAGVFVVCVLPLVAETCFLTTSLLKISLPKTLAPSQLAWTARTSVRIEKNCIRNIAMVLCCVQQEDRIRNGSRNDWVQLFVGDRLRAWLCRIEGFV
jgi:hypothetical protein